MSVLLTFGYLLVVLGILVFVHEAGHFLAAKWAGVWVHRFALGIGNPIPGLSFRRKETEYAICWLPLGGYVKMATAEEEATSSALEGGTPDDVVVPPEMYFEAKPVWKRMVIILAGVTMNALFAWMVFTGLAAKNGRAVNPETRVGFVSLDDLPTVLAPLGRLVPGDTITAINGRPVRQWGDVTDGIMSGSAEVTIAVAGKPDIVLLVHPDAIEERAMAAQALDSWRPAIVSTVAPGSPALQAGLERGDTILAVGGIPTPQWYDLKSVVSAHPGDTLALTVARGTARLTLSVVPGSEVARDADGVEVTQGIIGVSSAGPTVFEPLTLGEAFGEGFHATVNASTTVVRSIRGMATGRVSRKSIGGPILIAQMAEQSAQAGAGVFFGFLGIISINLAVLNLLPIPILDGGQFLFLLAEGVLRRPLSLVLRERLTLVGLILVAALMVFAFWNDLSRIFT